jgi:hypothetical protein
MIRRLQFVAVLAVLAVASLVGASAAGADYSKKTKRQFVSQCVTAAKNSAGKKLSKDQLAVVREYCHAAVNCLEGKLSAQELQSAGANDPAIKSCIRKAKKQVS